MSNIFRYWHIDWILAIFLSGLAFCYLLIQKRKEKKQVFSFISACAVMVICFFSPLQILSAHYLFSAHMAVHVLLLLIAAPFLTISFLNQKRKNSLSAFLQRNPFAAWLCGVGIMWCWHIPFVFNFCMQDMMLHQHSIFYYAENISLIAAGILFSLPIVGTAANRLTPAGGVVYLFTACIACSVLGLLVTFAPIGIYHHYLAHYDVYGWNTVIINRWHITQIADQQMAGLIMWVPCCLVYVSASMYLLISWLGEENTNNKIFVKT